MAFISRLIVITAFNSVANNQIDNLSITYIRNSTDIQNEYGEIISVGRNILYEAKNDKVTIKASYTVETKTNRVIVCVTLLKCDEDLCFHCTLNAYCLLFRFYRFLFDAFR